MAYSDPFDSPRFGTARKYITDLCLREKDFVQANRAWYMTFARDAFLMLNFKTVMLTKRVALPVQEGIPFIYTPGDYLELASISAPNEHKLLEPMIIKPTNSIDVGDLSMIENCGCGCGCKHDYCSSVRNFETITGTVNAKLPDNSDKAFTTTFRKVLLEGGEYVEENTVPVEVYESNIHVRTELQKQVKVLCNLDIEKCGCIKNTKENRLLIESFCNAIDVRTESGCAVRELSCKEHYGIDETGDKIYLPTNFRHKYIVLRYFSNSKTKDIMIPFLAKETYLSCIKHLSSKFDPKASPYDKAFWLKQYDDDKRDFEENLYTITPSALYDVVLAKNTPTQIWNGQRH